jgi:predicted nucleotidyltransferase component of viral defense system
MQPLRDKLHQVVTDTNSQLSIVEKDYALSYVLAGIASIDELLPSMIFKGGTALKKYYFGDYRFSEDLDFSTVNAPKGDDLEKLLTAASDTALKLLSAQGPFTLQLRRRPELERHPRGQEAFELHVKYPWHPSPLCKLKVEITHDEPVLAPPVSRQIIHGYGEDLSAMLNCYALEEVVSEKMRSLLQTHQRLKERGWNRPRSRDYYDLWRILTTYGDELDHDRIRELLPEKCKVREVTYRSIDDFFTPELLAEVDRHWESNLSTYVRDLPESSVILPELKSMMQQYINP